MNELTLRVAALKPCARPKRLSEMREAIVPVPSSWPDTKHNFVKEFVEAKTSNEQIDAVKKIVNNPDVLDFLADVLFGSPQKHSLRGTLTKLFSNNETAKKGKPPTHTHTEETLQIALCNALRRQAEDINKPNVSIDHINDVFVSVGGCLNNFPNGRDALAKEIYAFIPFVPKALSRFWNSISELNEKISPTRRNEFYLFIQNLLRFHVAYLVEFKLLLEPEKCQDLRLVNKIAELVARHVDTPWDVRSIAGLAIGQNARFFNEFDDYLNKCKDMTDFIDLPIKSASLLALQKTDYAVHAQLALQILTGMLDIVNKADNITNLLVYMTKHLYTYSKSLASIELTDRPLVMYDLILTHLLRFSIGNIPSTVETIRHMSANLFLQALQLAKARGQQSIINQVYASFNARRIPLNAVCLMIQQLVEVEGTDTVLKNCPAVYKKIFSEFLGVDDNVNTLYKNMMTAAYKEIPFERWSYVWCTPLIDQRNKFPDRLPTIERLIKVAVKLDHKVIHLLMQQRHLPFSSKLAALLTARSNGQHELVKTIMVDYTDQLSKAILGADDNTRMQALSFVAETPKVSEPYTQFEIDTIISYVENNANSPNSQMRQIGGGLLQKAIKRLELNLAQQLKETNPLPDDHMLIQFVYKLMNIFMLNLFPTANYGRRWLSMHLMDHIIAMMERLSLPWTSKLPTQTQPFLFHCLHDSYEHNKAMAAQLLRKMVVCANLLPEEMMKLLVSVRPPDSATATYQLQVYCQAESVLVEVPQPQQLPIKEPRYFAVLYWLLEHLRSGISVAKSNLTLAAKTNPLYGLLFASRHLVQQLKPKMLAEEQLWREYIEQLVSICMIVSELMLPVVASESPEGHLPAIKAKDVADVEAEVSEEQAIDDEVEAEVEVAEAPQAIAEAVAYQEAQANEEDSNAQTVKQEADTEELEDVLSIVPQLVLLCAWRSVKEVSLILGSLVNQAPLEHEDTEHYLLSKQQVTDIGEHFLDLLAKIKHRGAFEQAYVGFSLYCRRLWQSNAFELNELPFVWLAESMHMIAGKSSKAICPTRRSAGVPCILQALICTELQLGTHTTFSKSMFLLLNVCESRQTGPAAASARSHALNILRALFRCSELSDLVGEYIGRGVECALESIDAEEWPERNSATLLLSALMIRIFGVERARNHDGQLHIRNRMTGRIFFKRYPKLFDYFHAGLRQAAIAKEMGTSTSGQTVKLEAMLQFLSRLYPSSLEGTENTLNLSNFDEFLQIICCVDDDMTRQRASKVLANFMNPTTAKARMRRLLNIIEAQFYFNKTVYKTEIYTKDYNGLHGHLLQLLDVYPLVGWDNLKLIKRALRLLTMVTLQVYVCHMGLFKTGLNVLSAILKDTPDAQKISAQQLKCLEEIAELDYKKVQVLCKRCAISPKFHYVFQLYLNRLPANPEKIVEHMMLKLVRSNDLPQEMQGFTIDLWLCIIFQLGPNMSVTNGLVENFEIKNFYFDPDVVTYCKTMEITLRQRVAFYLGQSEQAIRYVFNLANEIAQQPKCNPDFGSKVYTLLGLMRRLDFHIPKLLKRRKLSIEPGLVICITRLVKMNAMRRQSRQQSRQQSLWKRLLKYALEISSPTEKPYVRYRAARLVDCLIVYIKPMLATADVEIISNYVILVLQLLVDDSELVRNYMAEMVSSCIEPYLQISPTILLKIPTSNMLPMEAEKFFLKGVLTNMTQYADNGSFLVALFTNIVEPFVSSQWIGSSETSKEDAGNEMEVVFDKEDPNVYCEALRVVSIIIQQFRNAFPNNTELISALDAVEELSSFSGIAEASSSPLMRK